MKPMNIRHGALLALALTSPTWAQDPEPAPAPSPTTQVHVEVHEATETWTSAEARSSAEHARALERAEEEQRNALKAVETARQELARQAEEERRLAAEMAEKAGENREQAAQMRHQAAAERDREREEIRQVRRELERAHDNLRRASREVARVHREIQHNGTVAAPAVRFGDNRAVIGVILGDSSRDGVRILGLSPDGPAERAGLQQGDVIVSLMGESLTEGDVDGRVVLGEAMEAVEAGDELAIVVLRNGEQVPFTVVAEERTPLSWHSITRLSAVPEAPVAPGPPSAPALVETIDVRGPEIESTLKDFEAARRNLEGRRIIIDDRTTSDIGNNVMIYEYEAFSDAAEAALAGTNIWFGVPLTRGLKLAELDGGLGEYFDTDRGVLVLEADQDNALQLRAGDVILNVDGREVRRPADVMRALRDVESGSVVAVEIKRQHRNETLSVEIPENRLGYRFDFGEGLHFDGNWDLRFRNGAEE